MLDAEVALIKFRRRRVPGGVVEYGVLPPHGSEGFTSTTDGGTIGVTFSGHRRAAWQYHGGPVMETDITPGSAFSTPARAVDWLRVLEPGEYVEYRPTAAVLRSMSDELSLAGGAQLPEVEGVRDPVMWAVAAETRAALLGGDPLPALAHSVRLRLLLRHAFVLYGGARPSGRTRAGLDSRRLARVLEYVDTAPPRALGLDRLADVAALSPFHFLRMFRRSTGLTPHDFVVRWRLQRARDLLCTTALPITRIAESAGYHNPAHFRRAFRRAFGVAPKDLRAG